MMLSELPASGRFIGGKTIEREKEGVKTGQLKESFFRAAKKKSRQGLIEEPYVAAC